MCSCLQYKWTSTISGYNSTGRGTLQCAVALCFGNRPAVLPAVLIGAPESHADPDYKPSNPNILNNNLSLSTSVRADSIC